MIRVFATRATARPVSTTPPAGPNAASRRRDGVLRPTLERVAFLALRALVSVCALLTLTWPPGFDHGLYAWTADVLVRGGLPYRDAWDMHGPLVPYLFALPQLLFGRNFWGVRLLDLLFLAAATLAVYRVARALSGPLVARWTALLFTLVYFSFGFNDIAQPDGWVALALLVVVERLLRHLEVPPARELLLFGAVVGLGTLIKPIFAAYGVLPLLFVAGATRAARVLVGSALLVAAGAAAPLILVIGWIAAAGAMAEFLEVHLRYTSEVYAVASGHLLYTRVLGVARFFGEFRIVALALPAVLTGAVLIVRLRQAAALILGWFLVAVALVALQDKFWPYQWFIVIPPAVLLGAVGLGRSLGVDDGALASTDDLRVAGSPVPRHRGTNGARLLALALLVLIVAHVAIQPVRASLRGARYVAGLYPSDRYLRSFQDGSFSPSDYAGAARWVRENTGPDAQVAMYTSNAGIAYLAERATAFRLAGWRFPVTYASGLPPWHRYRAEYLRDLERTRPAIMIVQESSPRLAASAPAEMTTLDDFPALVEFLESHYDRAQTVGTIALFRLRGELDPAEPAKAPEPPAARSGSPSGG